MTNIHITQYVGCPFSAALEHAQEALSRRDGLYLTPSPPLGERVLFTSSSTDDTTNSARRHDALLIAWRPQTPGLFPKFRGVLTVRPQHRGSVLRLNGQYEPPYGQTGKVFDFFAGRIIADRTMHHFLRDLAAEIETQYDRERKTGGAHVHSHPLPH